MTHEETIAELLRVLRRLMAVRDACMMAPKEVGLYALVEQAHADAREVLRRYDTDVI